MSLPVRHTTLFCGARLAEHNGEGAGTFPAYVSIRCGWLDMPSALESNVGSCAN